MEMDPDERELTRYPRALANLHAINGASVEGRSLDTYLMYQGFNFLQAYQALLFQQLKTETKAYSGSGSLKEFTAQFIALLSSVLAALSARLRRTPIAVYSMDRKPSTLQADFRMKELYAVLAEMRVRFVEFLHSPFDAQFRKNLAARGRFAAFVWAADCLYALFGDSRSAVAVRDIAISCPESEREFVLAAVQNVVRDFRRVPIRVAVLRFLLRLSGVRELYAIDDMRNCFELFVAAKLEGIRVTAIQHGHITKYTTGLLPYATEARGKSVIPDRYIVWSEYWQNELARLNSIIPASSISIGGTPQGETVSGDHEGDAVLIVYETDIPTVFAHETTKKILDAGYKIAFKSRPDGVLSAELARYGLTSSEPESTARVALGTYSTHLYKLVAQGMPVGVVVSQFDYGAGMYENGIAEPINLDTIDASLQKLFATPQSVLDERREKLLGSKPGGLAATLRAFVRQDIL